MPHYRSLGAGSVDMIVGFGAESRRNRSGWIGPELVGNCHLGKTTKAADIAVVPDLEATP